MADNGPHTGQQQITNYCILSDGKLKPARFGWRSELLQCVCVIDYSVRERNPYRNIWGVAFLEQAVPVEDSMFENEDGPVDTGAYISIDVVGGSLADVGELPEFSPPNMDSQLGKFYRWSDISLVPAKLSWHNDPPHLVGLRGPCTSDQYNYEDLWLIVFPGNPKYESGPFPEELDENTFDEPYITIDVSNEFRQSFHLSND